MMLYTAIRPYFKILINKFKPGKRAFLSGSCSIFLFLFLSCSGTEKTEEITAEITAAQMEGRTAAREIVSKNWKDTTQLKKQLLEIKSRQSKYIIDGKTKAAEAFDSAFYSTVKTVNPDLAIKIKEN